MQTDASAASRLTLAVGAALFSAGCVTAGIGLSLPWLAGQFGSDPLATIIQDLVTGEHSTTTLPGWWNFPVSQMQAGSLGCFRQLLGTRIHEKENFRAWR